MYIQTQMGLLQRCLVASLPHCLVAFLCRYQLSRVCLKLEASGRHERIRPISYI